MCGMLDKSCVTASTRPPHLPPPFFTILFFPHTCLPAQPSSLPSSPLPKPSLRSPFTLLTYSPPTPFTSISLHPIPFTLLPCPLHPSPTVPVTHSPCPHTPPPCPLHPLSYHHPLTPCPPNLIPLRTRYRLPGSFTSGFYCVFILSNGC